MIMDTGDTDKTLNRNAITVCDINVVYRGEKTFDRKMSICRVVRGEWILWLHQNEEDEKRREESFLINIISTSSRTPLFAYFNTNSLYAAYQATPH